MSPDETPVEYTQIPTYIQGFDDLIQGGFNPGTCLLLLTPPVAEAKFLGLELIYRGLTKNEPGLIVTTDASVEDIKMKAIRYGWNFGRYETLGQLNWVDAYSIYANKQAESTETIKRVGGPLALTDISIGISQFQAKALKKKEYYKLVFNSLSTMLTFNNPDTIYRFLRDTLAKIRKSHGIAIFTLDEKMHDTEVVETIKHLMDGTLKINQTDDGLTIRVLSLPTPGAGKKGTLTMDRLGFVIKPVQ